MAPLTRPLTPASISSKSSISQVLRNSTMLWGPKLVAQIRELEDHIGVAMHRRERFAKPAGRFVLYLDAY